MENKYQKALDYIKHNLEHLRFVAAKSKQTAPFIPDEYFDTLQQAIEDLELYKKAFEIMTDNKHTFFVCKGRGPARNEIIRDAILNQARKELEIDNIPKTSDTSKTYEYDKKI